MVASGPDLRDREERVRLGALIREARVAAQLRQEDVGAACGVRAQEVSRWENASAFCRPRQVAVIARLTGKPLEFFYPGGVPGEAARADATPALQDPRLESFERRLLMVERTLLERTLLLEHLSRSLDELRERLGSR